MRLRNLVSAADLPLNQHPKTFEASCTAAETVGDWVYVSGVPVGGLYSVRKVDITDYAKMPAVGVVASKGSDTQCVVQWTGEVSGIYSGLVFDQVYFVGVDARVVAPPPVPITVPYFWQAAGLAVDDDVLLINLNVHLTKRKP